MVEDLGLLERIADYVGAAVIGLAAGLLVAIVLLAQALAFGYGL